MNIIYFYRGAQATLLKLKKAWNSLLEKPSQN